MKKNIRRETIFLVILLLILIAIIIRISYAFLQTSFFASKGNTLRIGNLSLVLDESEGNAITVTADGPLADSEGVNLDNYYSFKLTNNGKTSVSYTIYLDDQELDNNDTRIDQKYVHYSLERNNSNNIAKELTGEQIIETGIIDSGKINNYKLRLWFASNMTSDEEGKVFKAKLRIEASSISDLAKKCKESGGDFIVDGECRKYYVMENNFIENADFSNGSSKWMLNGSLIKSVSNNEALISSNFSSNTYGIFQQTIPKSIVDHKYYGSQSIKSYSSTKKFFVGIESTNYTFFDNMPANEWHTYSYLFLYDSAMKESLTDRYHAFVFYSTSEFETDFYVRNPVYVDLTLMFGEGNEPSKDWCDKNLNKYIEYSESGVKTPITDINYAGKTSYYDVIDIS